jgi:hypothetical protein
MLEALPAGAAAGAEPVVPLPVSGVFEALQPSQEPFPARVFPSRFPAVPLPFQPESPQIPELLPKVLFHRACCTLRRAPARVSGKNIVSEAYVFSFQTTRKTVSVDSPARFSSSLRARGKCTFWL